MIKELLLSIKPPIHGNDGLGIKLLSIPPGEFTMGSDHGLPFAPEGPVHQVKISYFFWIGKFPITQGQYAMVMKNNPSHFRVNADAPIETMSWGEARLFCEKLSALSGRSVRLPTESEWEYACRAGTSTEYYFGDDGKILPEHAWFELNSVESTHAVGMKKPNPWGLYDMVGNVWEWCEDVWHGDYVGARQDGGAWMIGQEIQDRRSVRGAAWNADAFRCRSSYRSFDWKDAATSRLGFRIVVNAE